jgi:hypothetical protein
MQFYQLDNDPIISSKLLPDYALKSVNIREGYQILSDCGHALGLEWTEQNKEYNRYHPNTWRYWKTKKALFNFIDHYMYNLIEYNDRFGSTKTYETYRFKFHNFVYEALPGIIKLKFDYTEEQHIALYLLDRKRKYLSNKEIIRFVELVEGIYNK